MNNLYERIKLICEQNDMAITSLCLEVSGNKGNLATWKKGSIRIDYLQKIADKFGVSIDYLLGRAETQVNSDLYLDNDEKSLLKAYRNLNSEGKEKVIDYVDDLLYSGKYIKNNKVSKEA